MSWSGYEEGFDLETVLQGAIDAFGMDRREAWAREGASEALAVFDAFAKRVIEGTEWLEIPEMAATDALDWEALTEVAQGSRIRETLLEAVQVRVAWALCTGSDHKAARCVELMDLALRERPTSQVRKYLGRVGRAYIAGFGPECVILCRAVVEQALKDAFELRDIPPPATLSGRSPMKDRLASAALLGLLSADAEKAAREVWIRGNKAIHEDPEVTTDVLGTVRRAMLVAREVYDR
jgi:hypothetical protein